MEETDGEDSMRPKEGGSCTRSRKEGGEKRQRKLEKEEEVRGKRDIEELRKNPLKIFRKGESGRKNEAIIIRSITVKDPQKVLVLTFKKE